MSSLCTLMKSNPHTATKSQSSQKERKKKKKPEEWLSDLFDGDCSNTHLSGEIMN